MDSPSTPPLEELLTHARWARALARQLLRDEQRADDVVQEAWLAAVERPPRPGPGLRAWFARLIRNLASNQRRAELRRARHERGAAAPEVAPPSSASPSPILDEFAAQQLVAQALLALDEPYRETLLRRWYRDEKPAAIAHAMQVPVKTVDTRLARGLEKLRAELTARRGGSSREWCVLLAPLAQTGAATGAVAAWTGGALTMGGLAKLAAAVTVVAAAVAGWQAVETRRAHGPIDSKGRPVENAQQGREERTPLAIAAAADGATRSTELRPAPAVVPDDPLAAYRGDWHLHGRVVDATTRLPIAAVDVVAASGNGRYVSGPTLAEVKSDANGEFTLERLSHWTSLSLKAPGRIPRFEELKEADLADDRAAPPREFALEARTYGVLVCRLHARDGGALPRRIEDAIELSYGPTSPNPMDADRFEGLPEVVVNGPSRAMVIAIPRSGAEYRIERAPAQVAITLWASLGRSTIGGRGIAPLAPGETREVDLPIQFGALVEVAFQHATTGAPIPRDELRPSGRFHLRWTGTRARDHVERGVAPEEFEGSLPIPGDGRLELTGNFRGFAPFEWSGRVADGGTVAIPLATWRRLDVRIETSDGGPWKKRRPETIVYGFRAPSVQFPFMASGRAPSCLLVRAGEPLEESLDPDSPSVAALRPRLGLDGRDYVLSAFEGFAPAEDLSVGIYDEGKLIGTAEIPATAPPPPPPREIPASTHHGEVAPDPPSTPPQAERVAPIETVTVRVTVPPARDGSLRFRAISRDEEESVTSFQVGLVPLVDGWLETPAGEGRFEIEGSRDGSFSCKALPAGTWRMRIRRSPFGIDRWIGDVVVEAGRETDLGTLTLSSRGSLVVRVVDGAGAPAIDAEVRVLSRDRGAPLEFDLSKGFSIQTSCRTGPSGGDLDLGVPAGPVRVEARSDGHVTAFTDVEVPPNGKATCTITLKELESGDPPPAPEKR